MINIGICDDNPNELKHIKNLLLKFQEEYNMNFNIKSFDNGYLFLDSIQQSHAFEICFLDIYMPALSGIDTAKELRMLDKNTHLIFTTSSKEFALDGYSVQASNYLLKPLVKDTFFKALHHILQKITLESVKTIRIPTNTGFQFVAINTISYIEASSNRCIVNLSNETTLSSSINLTQMQELLQDYSNFVFISRSVLLNFDSVIGLENEKFIINNGTKITIPRRKKKELTHEFLNYRMKN